MVLGIRWNVRVEHEVMKGAGLGMDVCFSVSNFHCISEFGFRFGLGWVIMKRKKTSLSFCFFFLRELLTFSLVLLMSLLFSICIYICIRSSLDTTVLLSTPSYFRLLQAIKQAIEELSPPRKSPHTSLFNPRYLGRRKPNCIPSHPQYH